MAGLAAALVLVSGMLSAIVSIASPVQAAGPTGCGYGSTGPQAGALCWLDMSGYNQTLADSAAGQPLTVSLPGGYTISFTIKTGPFGSRTYNPVAPTAFPTWSQAYLGNHAYIGTPGKPALYATGNGGGATVTLSNISVKDSAGASLTGYGFVTADAETTNSNESLTFGSNVPLNAISTSTAQYPYCGGGLTGVGTTSVTCTGNNTPGTSGAYGALIVQANAPSQISASMVNGGKQGVAFALVVSQIQLTKTVVGRINPTDSFNISVTSPQGTVLGSASTGTANTATTGQLTVLPTTGGGAYTLSEVATPGTPTQLAQYSQSWSCTNNGTSSPSLPSGSGTSKSVIPQPGDTIACTLTNTANISPAITISKSASPGTVSAVGQAVTYTFGVTNTGNVSLSGVGVTDNQAAPAGPLTSGPTCTATTLAAGASTTCTATYTVTQADLDNGSINDTATASGTPASGPTVTSSPSSATVGVTRTGSLTLTKSASPTTVSVVGQTVIYRFGVTNNSNTTVTGLSVADTPVAPALGLDAEPSCALTTLAPGASTTCTAPYTVNQADLNNGSIKDSAVATGKTPGGAVLSSNTASATVTAVQTPSIALIKTASPTTVSAVGQTVTYTFNVTNTGNVTLTGAKVVDTQAAPAGALTSGPSCAATTLDSGASTTCTATYKVTQADLNNGSINDTATAVGTPPTGPAVTSVPSSASVIATQTGSLVLTKTASPTTVSAVGQTVTYTFTATNKTNLTVNGLSVADTQLAPAGLLASGPTCSLTTLAPGASTTCTARYSVIQADLDNGSIVDSAVGTTTTPTGATLTSNTATATVTAIQNPAVTVVKTATPTSVSTVGQIISYSFAVTNTGNVTLTGVDVADTQAAPGGTLNAPPSCPTTTLAPGVTTICTAAYAVTQADLDSGSINDTATASGTPPSGSPVTSAPSSASVNVTVTGTLALTKAATPTTVDTVGGTVTYTFEVTNNANVTVSGVTVADTQAAPAGPLTGGPTCDSTSLAPGSTATCTATYAVTQADIDNGSINDTATATGKTPAKATLTSNRASATVTTTQTPAITIAKSAKPTVVTAAGQIVTYSFLVTNTGNVTLTGVAVADTQAAPAGALNAAPSCPTTTLAPGTATTCTATYTVTQADVDNESIDDTAFASGSPPTGPAVTSAPSSATVSVAEAGTLALSKTASPTTVSAAGQTVTYTFSVTNTANVTLSNLTIADSQASPAGTLTSGPTCTATTLAPGASTTCTATYTVAQADIDHGSVDDSALASGVSPTGTTFTSNIATAEVTATPAPDISVTKTASPTTVSGAGQSVTYTFVVKNTGNVTLSSPTVTDTQAAPAGPLTSGPACPSSPLAPGGTATCTATYTVSQADLDNGSINDTAVANATTPTGGTVTSDPSMATVTASQSPAITVAKTASPTTVTAAGQHLIYSFVVTNTGNVTLTGVSVSDRQVAPASDLNAAPSCPATTLAPGAATTCTASYTATQADVDNGSINDTATAAGISPTGSSIVSTPSSATVTADQAGTLALTKTASPTTVTAAGQSVTYTFVVTNNTNVTVTGVGITDTQVAPAGSLTTGPTCDTTTLAPADAATCTATYTVTPADMDNGAIEDAATASAITPRDTTVVSNSASALVTAAQHPTVSMLKTASPTTVKAAGQTVTYTFAVTNTGNVTLTDLAVVDSQAAPAGALNAAPSCPTTTLAPGASTDCTAIYNVTQTDIDNGSINDTATVTGSPPTGPTITSTPSSATVTATQTGNLTLTKTASPTTVTGAGQTVTYTFAVTNTGNVTLTDLAVADSQAAPAGPVTSGPTCEATALAPAASTTCTAAYTVSQADIDHGSVDDTAVATASPPTGPNITSDPAEAIVTADPTPALTVSKTASPTTVTRAGQTITYTYTVTNTGNVTLTDISVADAQAKPAGALATLPACLTDTLAPGAGTTCSATYTVTQHDIDNGSIDDTASAKGTPPTGPPVTSAPSSASVAAPATGGLALTKTATPATVDAAGDIITYTFAVTNNTNVTISNVAVADTQQAPARGLTTGPNCPSGKVAPGLTVDCTATYTVTQTDVDHGSINDTATADATEPSGTTLTSNSASAVVEAEQAPSLSVTKTPSRSSVTAPGQTVTYTFAVTNTGNVTLTNLNVTDAQAAPAGSLTSGPICPIGTVPPAYTGTLGPGFTADCTGTYTVTQADINNGSISDTAIATMTDPAGATITSPPSSATVITGVLTMTKTANPTTVSSAGQIVTYTFAVTNNTDETLSDIGVTDSQTSPAGPLTTGPTCPAAPLPPGADTTCTATYTATQADIDHGSINDTAVAEGTSPFGETVDSAPSSAVVNAIQSPAIALTKTASPTTYSATGQVITYKFVVTDTGNVSLTGVAVQDTQSPPAGKLTTAPSCNETALGPGASAICTATYAVTQADLDHGTIHDEAIATANPAVDPPVSSATADATVTAVQMPALTVVKTSDPSTITADGETVTFDFAVRNTGNVSLTDVKVDDTQIASSGTVTSPPTCPGTSATAGPSLAPGQTIVCEATYVSAVGDISRGYASDAATASGDPPGSGTPTSSPVAKLTVDAAPEVTASMSNPSSGSPGPATYGEGPPAGSEPLANTGIQLRQMVELSLAMILLGTTLSLGTSRRRRIRFKKALGARGGSVRPGVGNPRGGSSATRSRRRKS